MGNWRYRKAEPVNVHGICVKCGVSKQKPRRYANGKAVTWRAICNSCDRLLNVAKYKYRDAKDTQCNRCGFKALDPCQLDVHHIDEDHDNEHPENLETLCANCHRLHHFGKK